MTLPPVAVARVVEVEVEVEAAVAAEQPRVCSRPGHRESPSRMFIP